MRAWQVTDKQWAEARGSSKRKGWDTGHLRATETRGKGKRMRGQQGMVPQSSQSDVAPACSLCLLKERGRRHGADPGHPEPRRGERAGARSRVGWDPDWLTRGLSDRDCSMLGLGAVFLL